MKKESKIPQIKLQVGDTITVQPFSIENRKGNYGEYKVLLLEGEERGEMVLRGTLKDTEWTPLMGKNIQIKYRGNTKTKAGFNFSLYEVTNLEEKGVKNA